MRTRAAVASLGLAAVLGLGLGVAHASSLTVASGGATTATAEACSTATVSVAKTGAALGGFLGYTGVRLTVPTACAGTDLSLTVYSTSDGSIERQVTVADVSSGTLSLSTGSYGVLFAWGSAIALTFDGWSVPATF